MVSHFRFIQFHVPCTVMSINCGENLLNWTVLIMSMPKWDSYILGHLWDMVLFLIIIEFHVNWKIFLYVVPHKLIEITVSEEQAAASFQTWAVWSYETYVNFNHTTQCHFPQDSVHQTLPWVPESQSYWIEWVRNRVIYLK